MSATTRTFSHLRPVPDSPKQTAWDAIQSQHLKNAAERMRDDAIQFSTEAAVSGDTETARCFSQIVTLANEVMNR